MKKWLLFSIIISTLTVSASYSAFAAAAEAPLTPIASVAAETSQGTTISLVIVTAQRRSEDVKEAPACFSVLGGVPLQETRVVGFEDKAVAAFYARSLHSVSRDRWCVAKGESLGPVTIAPA